MKRGVICAGSCRVKTTVSRTGLRNKPADPLRIPVEGGGSGELGGFLKVVQKGLPVMLRQVYSSLWLPRGKKGGEWSKKTRTLQTSKPMSLHTTELGTAIESGSVRLPP